MIRFTALVIVGALEPASVAAYEALVARADATAARALLSGQRPRPIASAETLLDWVIEATNTPPFLVDACLQITADKAEVAALLLPVAEGDPPTLTECLLALQANSPSIYLATAARLPPEARLIFNRLATGRFRTRLTAPPHSTMGAGTCHAILTMVDPAGPEGTFALPHGNGLAPRQTAADPARDA